MSTFGPHTVVTSAARSTGGSSGAIRPHPVASRVSLVAAVTASSGVLPTLDIAMDFSNDGVNWTASTADLLAQLTAVATARKSFTLDGSFYRVRWNIGGVTPSFTFSVTATEHQT